MNAPLDRGDSLPALPAVRVRHATENDAETLAHLAGELGYAATTDAMCGRLRTLLHSPADLIVVALDSRNTVTGWLQAHAAHVLETGFRIEIVGLIVSPATRRQGMGRALVAEAERWAASLGAGFIVVRSNVRRTESHAFYPALGYVPTKTQWVYRKCLQRSPAMEQ